MYYGISIKKKKKKRRKKKGNKEIFKKAKQPVLFKVRRMGQKGAQQGFRVADNVWFPG